MTHPTGQVLFVIYLRGAAVLLFHCVQWFEDSPPPRGLLYGSYGASIQMLLLLLLCV